MTERTETVEHAVHQVQAVTGDPHPLIVVGAGQVAAAIATIAGALGWRTTVTESLAEVAAGLTADCSVVVLSHDPDLDAPALAAALTAGVRYVGAMGARRTQSRRRDWLLANGIDDATADMIHGPIGLDIGADTPAEIALAAVAEIVALRRRATTSGSLADRPGPIHPDLPPGSAYCPVD
jgi:xanthine dehydrogenase accessory factor